MPAVEWHDPGVGIGDRHECRRDFDDPGLGMKIDRVGNDVKKNGYPPEPVYIFFYLFCGVRHLSPGLINYFNMTQIIKILIL
jgi:hypothetical protein